MTVRTRFAPSPTGYLHVGGIRTALFAWLVAKQGKGKFILRLEDTDQKREVAGADQHIMDSLHALGINYDEGPDTDGSYGPYRQSQRAEKGTYENWALKLLKSGRAYVDPYTAEEVQAFRDQAMKDKKPFLYRNHRPETLSSDWGKGKTLRFKSDPKSYNWDDVVMGNLSTGPEVIDDFVLVKSDGYPTYNFAHIVDDADMEVSHVIRGQEFLASVPNYLNLYEALGIKPPIMATMPHIMNEQGNKKLSKRDGAKDILDYIRDGYLPEALISFIASMGWNDGTEQEIFTVDELVKKFSLNQVQRSGARFDERRLLWTNGHFIRQLPLDDLYQKSEGFWGPEAAGATEEYKKQVLATVQERLKYFAELPELTKFFFVDLPVDSKLISEHKQLGKMDNNHLKDLLIKARDSLHASDFSLDDITERLNKLLEATEQKPVVLFSLIRIAITQAPSSPGLADTLLVLGKEKCLKRLESQLSYL